MRDQYGPSDLRSIAHRAMKDRGLEPDFPPDAIRQLDGIPVRPKKPTTPFETSELFCGVRSTTILRETWTN